MAAVLAVSLSSIVTLALAEQGKARLHSPVLLWLYAHIAAPLLRILLLLLFIVLAYPYLFGLPAAPPLTDVLAGGSARTMQLINWLFIISVLIPLLPVVGTWPGLVLPLQGLTAAGLVYSWLPGAAMSDYWPGMPVLLLLPALALLGYTAALWLGNRLAGWIEPRFNISHSESIISNALLIALQLPIIVIYAHSLAH